MAASPSRPLPSLTAELKPFFDGAREGRLVLQKCASCSKFRFPPQELCDHCGAWESSFAPVSGRGEILSFIVVHQVYHPAFAALVPYVVARIRLREGVVLTSNVIGIAPAQVRCGMPVEVTFAQLDGDTILPLFRAAPAA
jgi:uncharacterized OB-fold protein